MRGLVAVVIALAVASFSGCVELVGEEDPDLEAAADEAARALREHNGKVGHISGLVLGVDGLPLAGALVDLVTVAQVKTDDAGRFSFLDLTPGQYSLAAEAADHLSSSVDLDVEAGQYTRPRLELEPLPAPQAYMTVHRLDGYQDVSVLGSAGFFSCYCDLAGELGDEGLVEILVEGELDARSTPFSGYGFEWFLEAGNEEESSSFGGYEESPMRVSIPGEEVVAGADQFYGHFMPSSSLASLGQSFTVVVTVFYFEGAAEDYTGFASK